MSTDVDKKSHNLNPPIYKACKFGQVNKDIPQISDVNTVTKNTSLQIVPIIERIIKEQHILSNVVVIISLLFCPI